LAYYSERNNGELTFIDGHLRKQLDPDEIWNVAILDLDDEEADKLLLSYDYLTGQAGIEPFVLKGLVDSVQVDEESTKAISEDQAELAKTLIEEIMVGQEAMERGEIWDEAFSKLPDGERSPFQQMAFVLHDSQVEIIKEAIGIAKKGNDFEGSKNENSNGNALAAICEGFLNGS
jgi:hypothetical protein